MHPLRSLPTLLLSLSVLAAPPALAQAPGADDAPRSGAVLWVEPVGVVAGFASSDGNATNVYLPLGVSVPRGPRSAWTFELGLAQYQEGCSRVPGVKCDADGRMARALVGLSFSSAGQQRGFFVQPRLGFTVLRQAEGVYDVGAETRPEPAGTTLALDAGADVGYQWRVGPLYLATMVGLSGGPAFNAPASSSALLVDAFWNEPRRETRGVLAVNLNLLRVGWGS